tara:strand:- start:390 stop:602 length:213 start_codon:yes stop_codon:yes gene_type:complete
MTKRIGINGVVRDMTPEEETKFLETEKEMIAFSENAKKERENYITLKASAKAKLIAGEPLTEDEADTIVV